MAIVHSVLAGRLKTIFDTMDSSAVGNAPKDNQWLAEELAKAIDDQIKTASVLPGIAVSIPSTSPAGTPSQGATSATGSLQ
jgi:hypothetical protein